MIKELPPEVMMATIHHHPSILLFSSCKTETLPVKLPILTTTSIFFKNVPGQPMFSPIHQKANLVPMSIVYHKNPKCLLITSSTLECYGSQSTNP